MPSSNGRSSKNNKDDRTKKYKNPTTKTKKTNNDMATKRVDTTKVNNKNK